MELVPTAILPRRPEQVLEIKKFVQKPVARKLMVDKITAQKSIRDALQKRLIRLTQECARKPAG